MPIAAIALFAFVVQAFAVPYQVRLAYAFLLNLTLAIGVQVFMDNSGVLSFGHVSFMGVIAPNDFYFSRTLLVIAMVILGGSRSVSGIIVGSAFVSLGNELARTWRTAPVLFGLHMPQMFGPHRLLPGLGHRPHHDLEKKRIDGRPRARGRIQTPAKKR